MINFLMTSNENAWEQSPAFFPKDRILTEYLLPELKEKYGTLNENVIHELKDLPCVFCYEKYIKKDALIGYITDLTLQRTNARIDYTLTGERISHEKFLQLSALFDMGQWEWSRTHWTLKQAKLTDIQPYFTAVDEYVPKVFVSYSWSPPANQQNVFQLIERLEKDNIQVSYDKKDLHPGQDMNYFMEASLRSKEIDAVIIACNSDYAKKANARRGGSGYEAELILDDIRNKPMQDRYIPVVFECNEDGELPLPDFLKSRYSINLTKENGYDELKNEILHIAKKKSS